MQYEAGGREIARNRNTRVHCLPVQYELIMVPAEPDVDRPISEADQILHKRRLFQIRTIRCETERGGGARIELSRVGDDVVEVFVQKGVVRLHAKLEFVAPMIYRSGPLEISFAEPIVLKNFYWSRIRVGIEIICVVADHSTEINQRVRRKYVLVGSDSHRLDVIRRLALASGLLYLFIRNIVAREFVAYDESQAIS